MMITRVAALELARFGIRVNAVAPGLIETTFGTGNPELDRNNNDSLVVDEELPEIDDLKINVDVPMDRPGSPEEVAGSYLFLASEDAEYVTGHLQYVDGGYQIL